MRLRMLVIAIAVAFARPVEAQRPTIPDSALVRLLIPLFDSLAGNGRRADMQLVARDSATYQVFRRWGTGSAIIVAPPAGQIATCPASTDSVGRPLAEPTGYRIFYSMAPADSGRTQLVVHAGCQSVRKGVRGGPRSGYSAGMAVEIGLVRGVWRVVRYLWNEVS